MKAKFKSKLRTENRVALETVIPLDTPFLIYVDPSSACNFKCQFCPTGHKDLLDNSEYQRNIMSFDLFKKLVDDLQEFNSPIKVMRMNKIGEPSLNKHLPDMIAYAKASGQVEWIDFATNGSLLKPELVDKLIQSGLDRINISLEGINKEQYLQHAKVDINFERLLEGFRYLYAHKNHCEVTIKVPGNYLTPEEKQSFLDTFSALCDQIFIEELAPIWPSFDVEKRANVSVNINQGQYGNELVAKNVCSVIFYALAINSDGTVSACCPDWDQKLIVGDIKTQSLKNIWYSPEFNNLRRLHLQGLRKENPICASCGHISHSQIDNIDPYKEDILEQFENYVAKL
jgi:radical SAM protein with 4Fe4S-binding SPASM domain